MIIEEIVLEYHPEDLDKWKRGDKAKFVDVKAVPAEISNQPNYHFGEYFVLTYFEKARWRGYYFYTLGDWELNNKKYEEGRNKINELFPADKLTEYLKLRSLSKYPAYKGQPDLFLYMENGPTLFLEVKKERDKLHKEQLECLALIKSVLGSEIGIVYLKPHDKYYVPKKYELDLNTYEGDVISERSIHNWMARKQT